MVVCMKKLKDLIDSSYDIEIKGIAEDSRKVKEGYLFVATKGYNVDHFDYIEEAVMNGAVAVIANKEVKVSVPVIVRSDVNQIYPFLCQKFFDIVIDDFQLIGITGTDGKTTTATIIKRILNDDIKCAYMGTNGLEILDKVYPLDNTTPCTFELYDCLAKAKKRNVTTIVMEVSSEALLHKRVKGLLYDIVVITNITEDHLNIHKSLKNYIECKLDILNYVKDGGVVFVNGDDKNCQKVSGKNVYKFGCGENNDYIICDVKEDSGASFKIRNGSVVYQLESPFKGIFNVYNVAVSFLVGLHKGLSLDNLEKRIRQLEVVKGRCEEIDFGQNFTIVLDYAHTYNAILKILEVYKNKKIIVVTGAAGGREKEKRAKIGRLVLEKANFVIFTMDDPRYEDVGEIIDAMIGSSTYGNYLKIIDRKKAIQKAFSLASTDYAVLILGKGRDSYMAIEDRKEHYSDYEVIKEYFSL